MATKIKNAFVHSSLIKKINRANVEEKDNVINVYSRGTTILPSFVYKTFRIHNGKKFITLKVTEKIIGYKFGEFARTRFRGKDPRPKAINRRLSTKKEKDKTMGQKVHPMGFRLGKKSKTD